MKPPRIYGHEFCGEIVRFGPEAERQDLREGLYVSAEMHVTCGPHAIIAKVDSSTQAKVAESLEVLFDMEKSHLFDKDTEQAIF